MTVTARPIPWESARDRFTNETRTLALGRHVEHDERSRAFAATAAPPSLFHTTRHKRRVPIYDQDLPATYQNVSFPNGTGSCTAQASIGAMCTGPFRHDYRAVSTRLAFYARETQVDEFPGEFPAQDTGSSGLAAGKVLLERKLIGRYEHAFNLQAALTALLAGPIIIGVNWYDSMDRPGADGLVTVSPGAQVRGGHEMEVSELLLAEDGNYSGTDRIRLPQSWGTGFGDKGWIQMTIDTLARLLSEDGDATILIPLAGPTAPF